MDQIKIIHVMQYHSGDIPNLPETYTDPYVFIGKVMMFVESGLQTPKELVNNNSSLNIDLGINIPGS